jgi:hypothetical protein
MRLQASDPGDISHAFGWHAFPSIGRLPGNLQALGNRRHSTIFAQTADRRINTWHRMILGSLQLLKLRALTARQILSSDE